MYTDKPISTESEDRLDLAGFAGNLAKALIDWPRADSAVFGLAGTGGSGKTSLLNLVVDAVRNFTESGATPYRIVKFNPWSCSGGEPLDHCFFSTVAHAVSSSATPGESPDIVGLLATYGRRHRPGAADPVTAPPENEGTAGDARSLVRDQIEDALMESGIRYVIVIDDADRLMPGELLELFQLLNHTANFPMFRYLVAFDREHVVNALDTLGLDGEAYLQKFVQNEIQLPSILQNDIDRFLYLSDHGFPENHLLDDILRRFKQEKRNPHRFLVKLASLNPDTAIYKILDVSGKKAIRLDIPGIADSFDFRPKETVVLEGFFEKTKGGRLTVTKLLGKTPFRFSGIDLILYEMGFSLPAVEEFRETFDSVYFRLLRHRFKTLRDAKRFLNSLRFNLNMVAFEIFLADFIVLEWIKLHYPAVYKDIHSNWWFYIEDPYGYPLSNPLSSASFFPDAYSGDKRKKFFAEHIEKTAGPYTQEALVIIDVLCTLFPLVAYAFKRSSTFHLSENPRVSKRIYTSSFPKYFSLNEHIGSRPPDGLAQNLILAWNAKGADGNDQKQQVYEDIQVHLKDYPMIEILSALHIFMEPMTTETADNLLQYITDHPHLFPHHDIPGAKSPWVQSQQIYLDILEKKLGHLSHKGMMDDLTTTCPSLSFSYSLITRWQKKTKASEQDRDRFKRDFAALLFDKYFKDVNDIISAEPYWQGLLIDYAALHGREICERYLLTLFNQNKKLAITFLNAFKKTIPPNNNEILRINQLSKLADCANLLEFLETELPANTLTKMMQSSISYYEKK